MKMNAFIRGDRLTTLSAVCCTFGYQPAHDLDHGNLGYRKVCVKSAADPDLAVAEIFFFHPRKEASEYKKCIDLKKDFVQKCRSI